MTRPQSPPRAPPPDSFQTTAARPPRSPIPSTFQKPSTHYGALELPMNSRPSRLSQQPLQTSVSSSTLTEDAPVGPLSRVPSNPSFVPVMSIDLDALAAAVSKSVGVEYTTQQLLSNLADVVPSQKQGQADASGFSQDQTDEIAPVENPLWKDENTEETHNAPLKVVLAEEETPDFSDEALVLKISQQETPAAGDSSTTNAIDIPFFGGIDKGDSEPASGFAISVPIHNDLNETEPLGDEISASWEHLSTHDMSDGEYDEEDPLIPDDTGLNMSYKARSNIPSDGTAFVQRKGPRHVSEEQEVLYAIPHAENLATGTTGLFLPVVDSKNDLRELVLVVPPETGTGSQVTDEDDLKSINSDALTTAETTREYIENLTSQIPSIVEVDSTLEVHGTAENATVAMNVTKQVSWVGYAVLAVALLSVASQGTAVKWLPSVDGLLAGTWLMQTQFLIMLPLAIFQYCTINSTERENFQNPTTMRRIVAASLSQVCWVAGFFVAIDHTTLFHAWSLNNVHTLIIVLIALVGKRTLRRKEADVSKGEVQGAQIAGLGVLLMAVPLVLRGDVQALGGDLVAMIGSLGAIAFLNLCKTLRNDIPLFLMLTPIVALNGIFMSIGAMVVDGNDFSISDQGMLGWLSPDRMALGLYLGGVVGFLGTVCCIAALKYLPSVVVGSVQTMMPVAGTLLAVLAGADKLPDIWSTIGGGVLLYGVLMIADATRQSEVKVVINPLIEEVSATKGHS